MSIRKIGDTFRVDIQPGGRKGRRIRKIFADGEVAKLWMWRSLAVDSRTRESTLSICDVIDQFDHTYARINFRGYKFEKYRLQAFKRYFYPHNKPIGDFSFADASNYINSRVKQGMSKGTIGREINTLKRIMTWALEQGYLTQDPLVKLKRVKGNKRVRYLSEKECDLVLDTCRTRYPEIWEAVFVALNTGFRLSNILSLLPEDFRQDQVWDDEKRAFTVKEIVWARKTKSGKPYAVPVSENLLPLVESFRVRKGRLFDIPNLDKKFKAVMIELGFYLGKNHPDSVVFHTLRHTFGAYWLQLGVPIYTVSQWLGHSSVTMTEDVYAHLSLKHHVEQMKKGEGIGGRHFVDTQIIPFPQNASESDGPPRSRTENLVLKREE